MPDSPPRYTGAVREVAPDLWLLQGSTGPIVNLYLAGDVLIDAGWPWDGGRILRKLRGRRVSSHALTHAHPDHMGGSRRICQTTGVPLLCGAADATAAESGNMRYTTQGIAPWVYPQRVFAPVKGHPVERTLAEGDLVGGFMVIETPGHTPGHVSYFRERDRVLITGDVMIGRSFFTWQTGIFQPLSIFNWDHAVNRASGRKLAALRPKMICFGHGPVMTDPARLERLAELVDAAHSSVEG